MVLLLLSTKDIVLVDAGLKSDAIPAEQFKKTPGRAGNQVGDEVDVALDDAVEDGFGETLLSREAKRHEAWITLEKKREAETVVGVINGKVKR